MRYFILIGLLSGCTFRLETGPAKTDDQMQQEEWEGQNKKLINFCKKRCRPFVPLYFIPVAQRCICELVDNNNEK